MADLDSQIATAKANVFDILEVQSMHHSKLQELDKHKEEAYKKLNALREEKATKDKKSDE